MSSSSGDGKPPPPPAPADALFAPRPRESDLHAPPAKADPGAPAAPSATEDALWLRGSDQPVLGDAERRYKRIFDQLVALAQVLVRVGARLVARWEQGPLSFQLEVIDALIPSASISNDLRKDLTRGAKQLRELLAKPGDAELAAKGGNTVRLLSELVREEQVEIELLLAMEQRLGQVGQGGSAWNTLAEYSKQLGFWFGLHTKLKQDSRREISALAEAQLAALPPAAEVPEELARRLLIELMGRVKRQQPMAPGTF